MIVVLKQEMIMTIRNSVDEIRDKENSVREKGVDRVETENDDDDKKSVDDMRDNENSVREKGVNRVETGNDEDENKSEVEIRDKENSVLEKGIGRVETENDDDDKKSVDQIRDKENSGGENGVVGIETGNDVLDINGHIGTSGETGNNGHEQELDDVEQEQDTFSHHASAQRVTIIYEDISADEAGEIENSDGSSTPNSTNSDHNNSNVLRVASDDGGK